MTPLVLAVNLGLSFAGLTALCLSLNRHHAEIFDRRVERRAVLRLRAFGWAALAVSLFVAGAWEGWAFGPVQGFGALTGPLMSGLENGLPTPWLGAFERVNAYVTFVWMVALAGVLLRRNATRPLPAHPAGS